MFRTADFPVCRQLNQMDCGPTCLKIITKYFGKDLSLDYLRELYFLQKGGGSQEGFSQTLDSLRISSSLPEFIYEIPLPVIADWNGNPFLVVYKVTSIFVYVTDPAIGKIKYSNLDIIEQWKEEDNPQRVLILVEPKEEEFIEVKEKKDSCYTTLNRTKNI